jgi:hypothetical protein
MRTKPMIVSIAITMKIGAAAMCNQPDRIITPRFCFDGVSINPVHDQLPNNPPTRYRNNPTID